jgi:hypothetical protein
MYPAQAATIPARGRLAGFMTATLARELGILLTLSVMFPILVHIIPVPADERLGARLLPIFYAPLLASLWGRRPTAWLLALAAPWLNWVLTGHPEPRGAVLMMAELLAFVGTMRTLQNWLGGRAFLALGAFAVAKAASLILAFIVPALIGGRPVLPWTVDSIVLGAPGIAILVGINWLALRSYPPGSGHGPLAA